MKLNLSFKKQALSILLSLSTIAVFSQTQQHVWEFKNHEIDFTSGTPQVNVTDNDLIDYNNSHGIHDENGNMILKVVDGNVYNKFHQGIGGLIGEQVDSDGSLQIIPFSNNQCKYYIVYLVDKGLSYAQFTFYYAIVDLSLNNGNGEIIANDILHSSPESQSGFKYEDFATSTIKNANGDRYLYSIGLKYISTTQNVKIRKYLVNDSGISLLNTYDIDLGIPDHFFIGETELSHDGTMLAYSGFGSNSAINIFHLDAAGDIDFNTGNNGLTSFQIPNEEVVGLEFTPNSERIYYSHWNNSTSGISFIDLNTSSLSNVLGSSGIRNTPLELAYDPLGDYTIGFIDDNDFGIIQDIELVNPSISLLGAQIEFGMNPRNYTYSLPKQIDGEDYVERFNDPIVEPKCCLFSEGIDIVQLDVTSSQTWSPASNPFNNQAELIVTDELRIKAGSNVTFNDMLIRFEEDAKLVIEPDAMLIINNTTLTSTDCETIMWQGIELQGNANLTQTFANQGVFIMQSNSEISNALNGINVFGRTPAGNTDWNATGGWVRASNSTFRNNKRDVQFLTYNFKNRSLFRNCEFLTDAPLNNGSAPLGHVTMFEVDRIGFYGNDFKNMTTGLYSKDSRGFGIKSIDAKYKVKNRCNSIVPIGSTCNDKDPNVFEGLVYGIEATATNSFYTVEIMFNEFINNRNAIYLGGVDYAKVVNNEFDLDEPNGYSGFIPWTYGLYLENCTAYQVENNNFFYDNTGFVFGVIVNNSNNNGQGNDINEIYNNYFEGVVYGGATINENVRLVDGNAVTNTGLTFKCNDFVNSEVVDLYFGGPVSPFQGACLTPDGNLPHSPANNTFSPVIPSGAHLWNANGVDFQMDYRYSTSTIFQTEPLVINNTNTTTSACGNLPDYDSDVSCPENRFDLPNFVIINFAKEFRNTAVSKEDLINGGIKDELLLDIQSMNPGQLKNKLLSYAPYLSDEVLIAVLEKTPSLPPGIVKQIMFANAPLSSNVIDALEDQNIPNGIKNQIQSQEGISPVRELQAEISHLYREAALGVNEVIRRYTHDTTYVNGMDSIRVLLEEEGLVNHAKCKMVSMHIKNSDFQQADTLLTELEQNPDLSEFCEFQRQIIDLKQQTEKCFVMVDDTVRREKIEEIADRNDGSKECLVANRLLELVFAFVYEEERPDIVFNKSMFVNEDDKMHSYEEYIKVFPNPTSDILHIEAGLTGDEKADVNIYSLSGQLVKSSTISQQKSYIRVNEVDNGVYLIKITMPDGKIRFSKVMIN
jgi:hypothetical protein